MAKKAVQWESEINGKAYAFSYEFVKRKHVVTVNDVPIAVKIGFLSAFLGIDEEFIFDGIHSRIVFKRGEPDISVDDVLIRSGEPYIRLPKWSMIFIVACLIMVFLGGALPAMFGMGGMVICANIAKMNRSVAERVTLCAIVTIVTWVFMFVLGSAIHSMLAS
ncbi:MAG: hypothetical protein FWG87_13365 [Defluviitaleaceae bacterium]|nr:hypothetical protein [Defluviitaleaceae bacterium]